MPNHLPVYKYLFGSDNMLIEMLFQIQKLFILPKI